MGLWYPTEAKEHEVEQAGLVSEPTVILYLFQRILYGFSMLKYL